MIAYIKGELVSRSIDKVVVEVNGMGYGVYVPATLMESLPNVGSSICIHTYLNVREDAMQLFGFNTIDELEVFKLLITVNGIGPKGGLAILSALSVNELRFAVVASDVKAISSAQGVGKKTAEKLIIELKDKLKIEDVFERGVQDLTVNHSNLEVNNTNEVLEALVALGYDASSALKSINQIDDVNGLSVEEILKLALKNMMF